MEYNVSGIPRQAIPHSQKGEKWKKETVDAIIDQSSFNFSTRANWRYQVAKWYEYYNGVVDEYDYDHVLKPYGKARKHMPVKLRNYNIIKPTIDLLLGEFSKRPDNYTVVVSNPDVNTVKAREKSKVILENLKEHFVRELERLGI